MKAAASINRSLRDEGRAWVVCGIFQEDKALVGSKNGDDKRGKKLIIEHLLLLLFS